MKKKKLFFSIILSILFCSGFMAIFFERNYTLPGPIQSPLNWQLLFFDDFTNPTLNETLWSYNYPEDWPNEGHTHNHQAYMAEENVIIENGLLRIIAENKRHPDAPEPEWGWDKLLSYNFTSGAIHSRGKFNFSRGYIEGRFRMPSSVGFWPAFWMLKDADVGLPEVDILEVLSSQSSTLYTTVHYGHSWDDYSSFGWRTSNLPELSADFHTYGVEISDKSITWFFDGQKIGRVFRNKYWINQCFDLFIIINLAIGGWEVNPDSTTIWPNYYDCDWIKVWIEK